MAIAHQFGGAKIIKPGAYMPGPLWKEHAHMSHVGRLMFFLLQLNIKSYETVVPKVINQFHPCTRRNLKCDCKFEPKYNRGGTP